MWVMSNLAGGMSRNNFIIASNANFFLRGNDGGSYHFIPDSSNEAGYTLAKYNIFCKDVLFCYRQIAKNDLL